MASERKDDSDQDEDEDPWGLNRFEEEALAGLAALRSGIAPTPERIDRSPETETSREHHPDPPVIVSTPPHSPLRTRRSRRSTSVPRSPRRPVTRSITRATSHHAPYSVGVNWLRWPDQVPDDK